MNNKPFFAYRSFWKQIETKKRFYDAGIRHFCVFPANTSNSIGEPYCEYPTNWKWYDKYDFSVVDQQFEDLLAVAPDAKVLCMLDLNSPNWLVKDLNCKGVFADSFLALTDALAAEQWMTATRNYLRAIVEHIEEKYGDRVLSYLLAAGTTDEWMDYSTGRESAGKLERYSEWCKQHELPEPDCIPTFKQRFNVSHPPYLRDPEEDKDALQYWKFHSDLVADSIIDFCSLVRGLISVDRKIGVFYGYILQLGIGRLVQCGHLAYEKVLAADCVDYVTSPGIYDDRAMGGGGGFMNVNGTVKRFGKSYFHEIDHATYTSNWKLNEYVSLAWMVNWPDEKATIAGLRREFCRSLLHGSSLWWFDMWGGFYDSDRVLEEIASLHEIWNNYADFSMEPTAEIAVVVDPDSVYYIQDGADDPVTGNLHAGLLSICNRLGTSYKVFSLNDMPFISDLDDYKMIILPGYFEVTAGKREMLDKYILNNHRTVIWTYGAALCDGKAWSPGAMQELTGAEFGEKGIKETDKNGWKSIYAETVKELSPELLREQAVDAGVHLYSDHATPVFANDRFIMMHVADRCRVKIKLKRKTRVRELLDRKFESPECDEFIYNFNGPETVLFELY